MTCPICKANEAEYHLAFGVLPCRDCQERREKLDGPDHPIEFTSAEIKESRRQYLRSTIQPWRSGELSKEYLDLYGTKGISVSKREIANAKPVWSDLPNHDNLTKTT